MNQISITSLSLQRRQLVELMQDINFGRITNISVCNGEPELSSETIIEREIKLAGQNGQRPECDCDGFILKKEVVALLEHLSRMGNGTIRQLEVKHGLPFLMRVWKRAA